MRRRSRGIEAARVLVAIDLADDVTRILRSMKSKHLVERSGAFQGRWRNGLTHAIFPFVADRPDRFVVARAIVVSCLDLRDSAVAAWAANGGRCGPHRDPRPSPRDMTGATRGLRVVTAGSSSNASLQNHTPNEPLSLSLCEDIRTFRP